MRGEAARHLLTSRPLRLNESAPERALVRASVNPDTEYVYAERLTFSCSQGLGEGEQSRVSV